MFHEYAFVNTVYRCSVGKATEQHTWIYHSSVVLKTLMLSFAFPLLYDVKTAANSSQEIILFQSISVLYFLSVNFRKRSYLQLWWIKPTQWKRRACIPGVQTCQTDGTFKDISFASIVLGLHLCQFEQYWLYRMLCEIICVLASMWKEVALTYFNIKFGEIGYHEDHQ
jgi:hypothetical protein